MMAEYKNNLVNVIRSNIKCLLIKLGTHVGLSQRKTPINVHVLILVQPYFSETGGKLRLSNH